MNLNLYQELAQLRKVAEVRLCQVCNTPFPCAKDRNAKFCGVNCRVKAYRDRKAVSAQLIEDIPT